MEALGATRAEIKEGGPMARRGTVALTLPKESSIVESTGLIAELH